MKPTFRHVCSAAFLLASPHSALALPPGYGLNVDPDKIAHNDILAWSLMAVLGLTLGLVTACGVGIFRQFRRSRPEAELLEEIKRQASLPGPVHQPRARPATPEKPWERPADWWKNPPQD